MRDTANAQITLLTRQLQWAWERDEGPPNHCTIARRIENTIQSRLHEPCGCGESNTCLQRITQANDTLNSTKMKSVLDGFDPSAKLL